MEIIYHIIYIFNKSLLHHACYRGNNLIVEKLIEQGAEINVQDNIHI